MLKGTQKCIFIRALQHPPILDIGNIIRTSVQIRGYVCRKQNRAFFALHNLPKNMKHLLTGYRIQARSRFIQNQQLGVVGQRQCKQVFYFHSIGKFLEFPAFIKAKCLIYF